MKRILIMLSIIITIFMTNQKVKADCVPCPQVKFDDYNGCEVKTNQGWILVAPGSCRYVKQRCDSLGNRYITYTSKSTVNGNIVEVLINTVIVDKNGNCLTCG